MDSFFSFFIYENVYRKPTPEGQFFLLDFFVKKIVFKPNPRKILVYVFPI